MVEELDRDVFLWVVEHRAAPLDWFFVSLSVVTYAGLLWIGIAVVLAALDRRPVLVPAALTAGTVWAADLLTLGLKTLAGRARPYETLPAADPLLRADVGHSLPSGHAATSFAGAVILAYLFRRFVVPLLLLAVLVSFGRVYVGVHYPLDVLLGALVGTLVAFAVIGVMRLRPRISAGRRRSGAAPPAG